VPRDTDATKRLARKRTSDTAAAYVSQRRRSVSAFSGGASAEF
jgi:hypothetical protein